MLRFVSQILSSPECKGHGAPEEMLAGEFHICLRIAYFMQNMCRDMFARAGGQSDLTAKAAFHSYLPRFHVWFS